MESPEGSGRTSTRPGSAPPSVTFDAGMRRAATGLFVAGTVQVMVSLPFGGETYPTWWTVGVAPVLLLALGAVCAAAWRSVGATGWWIVALCGLTLALSLTASVAVWGTPTTAANAVVPLVQFGAFAAATVPGRVNLTAAVLLVTLHRVGLVLAGTGSLPEHLTSASWEFFPLLAAAAGAVATRRVARRVDEASAELARAVDADTLFGARHTAARTRASLMHDVVLNDLVSLGLGVPDLPEVRADYRTTARRLRAQLKAPPAVARSVVDEIDAAAEGARAAGIAVELSAGGSGPVVEPAVATALRLAVEEALRNVARHSGVGAAAVDVRGLGDRWLIRVSDDGAGFDPDAVPDDRLGLRGSVHARVVDAGGSVSVDSAPGAGTSVGMQWPAALEGRPGPGRSRARWEVLGELMWPALLVGLCVLTVANLLVLVGHWGEYRSPLTVLGLFVLMTVVAFAIWACSPTGIGPGVTVLTVGSAAFGMWAISHQLPGAELAGTANWVAGYGAMALVLLPYSRPAEEVLVAAAAVLAVNVVLVVGAVGAGGAQHLAALAAGSAPSITVGATLLVVALRRTIEAGDRQREEARLRSRLRAAEEAAADELEVRRAGCEREAVELLESVADGRRSPADPGTVAAAIDVHAALRAELALRLRQSLLQAMVLDDPVEVRDEDNLGRLLTTADRLTLVGAARGCAPPVLVSVAPGLDDSRRAQVIVRAAGRQPPDTDAWRELNARQGARLTEGAGRWFFGVELDLRPGPGGHS